MYTHILPLNQNTPVWFYLEGKIFPHLSVCWSWAFSSFIFHSVRDERKKGGKRLKDDTIAGIYFVCANMGSYSTLCMFLQVRCITCTTQTHTHTHGGAHKHMWLCRTSMHSAHIYARTPHKQAVLSLIIKYETDLRVYWWNHVWWIWLNHTLLWCVLIAASAGTFCRRMTVMIGLTCVHLHLHRGHRVSDLGLF